MFKKNKQPETEEEKLLQRLIAYVEQNGIEVKFNRGNFRGGLVRYHDRKYLYLNRKNDVETKIKTIVNELKTQQEFDWRQIPEELRSQIKL